VNMSRHATLIRLEHVSKSFGRRPVIEDLSFEVLASEAFCILGKSGTGKSVTLKLMIGLLPADRGSIWIDGDDVQGLERKKLLEVRKMIGFMFQDGALFDSISLSENLAFPLRRHTSKTEREIREIVREKLSEVGLEKELKKMPADLSGGMRKRAGLARALILDPPILLVDEPGSGLDPLTAAEIYGLLRELKERQGTTLVVVTHDAARVRGFADRLGVLDGGRMIACGTPEDLADSRNELVRILASAGEAKDVVAKS
jgi:phospholipid/cholesterol/gamma-HCH transport system ATP-binding protein